MLKDIKIELFVLLNCCDLTTTDNLLNGFFYISRRLQYEKEDWTKQVENSLKDNTLLKDQQQTLLHRLSNIEAKLNTVENEVIYIYMLPCRLACILLLKFIVEDLVI